MRRRWMMTAMLLPLASGCAAGGAPADKVPPGQQVSYNDGKTLDQALTGLVPGKPVSCLPINPSPPSSGYGSTILYRYSGKRIYRNDLGPGCEGIGRGDILVTSNPIGRSCRGDIIRTVDRTSGITTGGCAFNDFIPYEAPR